MPSLRPALSLAFAVLLVGTFLLGRRSAAPDGRNSGPTDAAATAAKVTGPGPGRPASPGAAGGSSAEPVPARMAAPAVLARLTALKISARQPRSVRQLLVELEALRELGPAALPAIREFLANGQDADYDAAAKAGFRDGKVPADFLVPPSLRLALLEVVKNIGGAGAEDMLARELRTTGRSVEAAYLASALEQIAPGKYQEVALAAARDLLAMPLSTAASSPLDRSDREFLYAMLAAAGDRSQLAQAQAELVSASGKVDRGALRYLQQALGEEAVGIAAQTWQDPRVPPAAREPLARVALAYVGTSPRAEQLYETAINDTNLSPEARKNLIEDLNQDGFANLKQLTPADLPLIQRRLALIDQLAPRAKDAINAAAFAEARKDLAKMRDAVIRGPPPKP